MTTIIDGFATGWNAIITDDVNPLIVQGTAQTASLTKELADGIAWVNTQLTAVDKAIKGLPGLVAEGLGSVAADAQSGN